MYERSLFSYHDIRAMINLQDNEYENFRRPCSRWPFVPYTPRYKWKLSLNRPVPSYKRCYFEFRIYNLFWYSDWLRAGWPRGLNSSPGGVKNFLHLSRPAMGPTQTIHWLWGALSLGVERRGREDGHSPQTSAKVKDIWFYTVTPPSSWRSVLLVTHRDSFTLHAEKYTINGRDYAPRGKLYLTCRKIYNQRERLCSQGDEFFGPSSSINLLQ
jgi:hypothetical protein